MTKLFLIRHGETLWNQDSKYQGHSDVALSPMGTFQAKRLSDYLVKKGFSLDAVYASDLSRAYQTAKIIAEPYKVKVELSEAFREINFGIWEGLTFKEIQAQYYELAQQWLNSPESLEIPKGESFIKVKERASAALMNIIKQHPEENVAIVSHGGTIRTIICSLFELPLTKIWQFRLDNTALTIFDFYNSRPILNVYNFTGHLD